MRVKSIFFPLVFVLAFGANLQADFNDDYIVKKQQINNVDMVVNHKIINGDLYIECIVPNFNFTQNENGKKSGEGHLVLFINGTKVDEIHRAAFILKDLPPGTHTIKVQVVHNDNSPYKSLEKEILVEIPQK
jgi:hypothetical protein